MSRGSGCSDSQRLGCRELTSYEVIVLKTAVAQVLAPYGVVTGNVQIGAPRAHSDKHSGRRLLQASSYLLISAYAAVHALCDRAVLSCCVRPKQLSLVCQANTLC